MFVNIYNISIDSTHEFKKGLKTLEKDCKLELIGVFWGILTKYKNHKN